MIPRKIALLISAAVFTNAISLPQHPFNISTEINRTECDVRLWVRADDLSPSTIVEGDVRLLNNMSSLAPHIAQGCRILDWSLHLRYRERGAIQIPLSNIQLPVKPTYNYSWGESSPGNQDYQVNRILSNGEDISSLLFETVVNPYEAEIEEYHQKLQEYVKAVSNADKWIVREDEVTFFEASLNMSSPLEVSEEGFQHSIRPFHIAVPSVQFPEADNRVTYHFSGEDLADRILTTDEMDMSYFAKLHLANGSVIEVPGGRTKFFTPGRNEAVIAETFNLTLLEQEREADFAVFSAFDGSIVSNAANLDEDKNNTRQHLFATIVAPNKIIRGKTHLITGQISSEEFIATRIWIDIHTQRKRTWAHNQIEQAGTATSRNKTDLIMNSQMGTTWSPRQIQDHSSALYLRQQVEKQGDERETDMMFSHMNSRFNKPSRGHKFKSKDGSFSLEYIPGGDFYGFGSTYFAEHQAEYVIKVEAKRRIEHSYKDGQKVHETTNGTDVHQELHDSMQDWSEYGGISCLRKRCSSCSDAETDLVIFKGTIPIIGFSNEAVRLEKRNASLRKHLDRQNTKCLSGTIPTGYLEDGASAPIFVDLQNEDKISQAVSLVNPCSPSRQVFPLVNLRPVISQHIPASFSKLSPGFDKSMKDHGSIKYRNTKYHQIRRRADQDCWSIPGSCGGADQNVGTVWVNQVMLPKLKSDANKAKVYNDEGSRQDTPLPIVL